MTQEEMDILAEVLKPNIEGQTTTTHSTQTTPKTTSTVTTAVPAKNSSSSTYTEYSEAVKKGANEEYDKSMARQGYKKNEKGDWVKEDNYVSSVLNLKKHNEEVERVNRAKALNSGLFNAVATIGDMISAGVGGNVYKREKNTIAEDAAKDTIARRDAMIQAEATAREKDRQDLLKALQSAKAAHDKYLELNGIKRTNQTQDGYQEVRTTENSGGKTSTYSSTQKYGSKRNNTKGAITPDAFPEQNNTKETLPEDFSAYKLLTGEELPNKNHKSKYF